MKQLYKPEYFYKPHKVLSRIRFALFKLESKMQPIPLIWGRELIANPVQTIGKSLFTFGLYDLALSEIIYRLIEPGTTAIDAGANVGYTSQLILAKQNGRGKLYSYEPLPELHEVLIKNTAGDQREGVHLLQSALSDQIGTATLTLPENFGENDGIATLQSTSKGKQISVPTTTIDALNLQEKVRLLKIDVEGHELAVLKGAEKSMDRDLFEYIVFEDLNGYPGDASQFLESKGYQIFKLVKDFKGLKLMAPEFKHAYSYEPDNFIAMKNKELVEKTNLRPRWEIFSWKAEY